MSFDSLVASDDPGVAWLIEVSFDDFATIAHRWATASYQDAAGNNYDGRIASLTNVARGFGNNHLPVAATTKVTLDNSDFGVDWLIDLTTVATQVLQARFRLSALAFDSGSYAGAASLTAAPETFCIYCCLDQPELADNLVTLTLADDSLGRLAEPLTTPTVRDWLDSVSPLTTGSPTRETGSPLPGMDLDVPLPLVFGLGEFLVQVPAYTVYRAYEEYPTVALLQKDFGYGTSTVGSPPYGVPTFPLVVCAAKSDNYLGTTEITRLQAVFNSNVADRPEFGGVTIEIPRSYNVTGKQVVHDSITGTDHLNPNFSADPQFYREIWTPKRSLSFTKDGREWEVVFIAFNVDVYALWFRKAFPDPHPTPSGANTASSDLLPTAAGSGVGTVHQGQTSRDTILGAIAAFRCNGSPLSVVTQRPAPGGEGELAPSRLLVDFIKDAIAYYSKATLADLDTAAFERAAKARATVWGSGVIQPSRPQPLGSAPRDGWISPNPQDGVIGVLRTALGEMCGSCDTDLFMKKSGLYSVSTNVFDFEAVTGARTDIEETRITGVRVRTPSAGERWAPYNRVMLVGPGGVSFGPYDNQAAITAWGRVMPVTMQAKWNQRLTGIDSAVTAATVWNYRALESRVRPVVRFVADRTYVALELGDYITFTWSRGGQATVFDGTLFRVEQLRITPVSLAVEVEAVWVGDFATESPFLLDDEAFITRVSVASGRDLHLVDGSATVTFSGGVLVDDGVVAGDILVLKDTTQADDVFSRSRELRILSVDDDDVLTVVDADLDFDAGAGVDVACWEIRAGATSYPTSVSDPTHYPSGGAMYGKASNASDRFSDGSTANLLKDG